MVRGEFVGEGERDSLTPRVGYEFEATSPFNKKDPRPTQKSLPLSPTSPSHRRLREEFGHREMEVVAADGFAQQRGHRKRGDLAALSRGG